MCMKICFVTCVKLGLDCLNVLIKNKIHVHTVITLTDNLSRQKSGRVFLDKYCEKYNLNLIKCKNINEELLIKKLKRSEYDYVFVIGWSQICKTEFLKIAKIATLGIHPTLLPYGRGRAALPWAILKQLTHTGVTMFKLSTEVDDGPIFKQIVIRISNQMDAEELYKQVCECHINLMELFIKSARLNKLQFVAQNHAIATYWPGRKPSDGLINLSDTVKHVHRLVRATTRPYPGAYLFINNFKYKIWKVKVTTEAVDRDKFVLKCSDGNLEVTDYEKVTK